MNKLLRYMLYIIGGLLLVLYLFFRFGMSTLFGGTPSDKKLQSMFAEAVDRPTLHTYEKDGMIMNYADMGADSLPTIVFVHGSPGSWDAYLRYFLDSSLVGTFRMIAVDRIGYGKSSPGMAESSLHVQAEMIQPVLELIPDGVPTILVGHSFGGPVVYKMAMEQPDQVDALLVLAGLADPANENRLWIQKPLRSKWLRWLLPPDLDVSNREIVPLKGELEEMKPDWAKINVPTTIIQGGKDMLVGAVHADFAEQQLAHIPATQIRLPEENHFIVWTQQKLVCEQLLDLLEQVLGGD